MQAIYLYINAVLYLLFAIWCTIASDSTSTNLGYRVLSAGGRSEYLVIYGGLQLGLAVMFWLLARDSQYQRLGILISAAIYVPIVLYRVITVAKNWPVPALTLGTGILEATLMVAALVLLRLRGGTG